MYFQRVNRAMRQSLIRGGCPAQLSWVYHYLSAEASCIGGSYGGTLRTMFVSFFYFQRANQSMRRSLIRGLSCRGNRLVFVIHTHQRNEYDIIFISIWQTIGRDLPTFSS